MAFWKKKSDDPWDCVPEKRRETEETLAQEVTAQELTAEELRIRSIIEGQQKEETAAEICPRCGKEMLMGYLYGGRDAVRWKEGERKSSFVSLFDEEVSRQMVIRESLPSWYCENCKKLTLDASGLELPVSAQRTSFHEYVDQWKEVEKREREEDRRKKQED